MPSSSRQPTTSYMNFVNKMAGKILHPETKIVKEKTGTAHIVKK